MIESGIVQEINDRQQQQQQQLAEEDNIIDRDHYSPYIVLGPSIFDEYLRHRNILLSNNINSNNDTYNDNDTDTYTDTDTDNDTSDFSSDFDYGGDFTLPFDLDFEYGYGGDGLSEEIISKYLQTKRVSSWGGDGISNIVGEICVVCQDELGQLQQNETVIATLDFCGHEYHFDCIKQWLQQKNSCPLCKAQGIIVL